MTAAWSQHRYVSLGSSFAAGPGIAPRAADRPRKAGQSQRNYPHLLADRLNLDLVDATSSGATALDIITRTQFGQPPQIEAVTTATRLVTLTIGGNDLGYVASLYEAFMPRWLTRMPGAADRVQRATEPSRDPDRRTHLADTLVRVVSEVQRRAPEAVVICIDYLTVLPPTPRAGFPLDPARLHDLLTLTNDLNNAIAAAARHQDVGLVAASQHSIHHHAWSADPWTTGWSWPKLSRAAAFHPTASGMAEITTLLLEMIT